MFVKKEVKFVEIFVKNVRYKNIENDIYIRNNLGITLSMIIDMCESVQSYTNCKKSEMTIN
jgi:hypothetical protein